MSSRPYWTPGDAPSFTRRCVLPPRLVADGADNTRRRTGSVRLRSAAETAQKSYTKPKERSSLLQDKTVDRQ